MLGNAAHCWMSELVASVALHMHAMVLDDLSEPTLSIGSRSVRFVWVFWLWCCRCLVFGVGCDALDAKHVSR